MFFLGPYKYSTKAQLKKRLKLYLANGPRGKIYNAEAIEKLHHLIRLHPRFYSKFGEVPIVGFHLEENELGSGASFVAELADGKKERFSYKKCIDGDAANPRSYAVEAFRFITRRQMREFRTTITFPASCALTGNEIADNPGLEIDHEPPFHELLSNFCERHDIHLEKVLTKGGGEGLTLEDATLTRLFEDFHRENAVLRPVDKKEHQKG